MGKKPPKENKNEYIEYYEPTTLRTYDGNWLKFKAEVRSCSFQAIKQVLVRRARTTFAFRCCYIAACYVHYFTWIVSTTNGNVVRQHNQVEIDTARKMKQTKNACMPMLDG